MVQTIQFKDRSFMKFVISIRNRIIDQTGSCKKLIICCDNATNHKSEKSMKCLKWLRISVVVLFITCILILSQPSRNLDRMNKSEAKDNEKKMKVRFHLFLIISKKRVYSLSLIQRVINEVCRIEPIKFFRISFNETGEVIKLFLHHK